MTRQSSIFGGGSSIPVIQYSSPIPASAYHLLRTTNTTVIGPLSAGYENYYFNLPTVAGAAVSFHNAAGTLIWSKTPANFVSGATTAQYFGSFAYDSVDNIFYVLARASSQNTYLFCTVTFAGVVNVISVSTQTFSRPLIWPNSEGCTLTQPAGAGSTEFHLNNAFNTSTSTLQQYKQSAVIRKSDGVWTTSPASTFPNSNIAFASGITYSPSYFNVNGIGIAAGSTDFTDPPIIYICNKTLGKYATIQSSELAGLQYLFRQGVTGAYSTWGDYVTYISGVAGTTDPLVPNIFPKVDFDNWLDEMAEFAGVNA